MQFCVEDMRVLQLVDNMIMMIDTVPLILYVNTEYEILKECYQKLEAYPPGEQPRDMVYIKLNTNESPFPPAPSVVQTLQQEDVEKLRLYSDPTCKVLKEKLAGLYGMKPENIFVNDFGDFKLGDFGIARKLEGQISNLSRKGTPIPATASRKWIS